MSMIKEGNDDRVFNFINLFLVTLLMLIVLYPLIYVLSSSVSNPNLVNSGEVWLYPKGFTLEGYKRVFLDKNIMTGYGNTIIYTVFGTLLNLVLTLPGGYALSKKTLPGKGLIMGYLLITMYFSGGMIPTFLLVKNIGLFNTRAILIIGGAVSVYNLIIARTFLQGVPKELEEAALIDGCSTARSFVQIVIPLSKALIGVLTLFYGVAHWNSYFDALIYINDVAKKPLQIFLREILIVEAVSDSMSQQIQGDRIFEKEQLKSLLKYSVIIVSSVPILVVYPFLQKYFDKGVLLGSLKG